MEHLDIVCGREGGRMSRMWRKRRSSEVFRRESAAQGPIIDGGFKESLGWEAI